MVWQHEKSISDVGEMVIFCGGKAHVPGRRDGGLQQGKHDEGISAQRERFYGAEFRRSTDTLCSIMVQEEVMGHGQVSGWVSGSRVPSVRRKTQKQYV